MLQHGDPEEKYNIQHPASAGFKRTDLNEQQRYQATYR